MTESEWMVSSDPGAMLRHVTREREGWGPVVSDRKLRLFAAACARSVWHLLTDERSRRAGDGGGH